MEVFTRIDGQTVGINSRRVLHVDYRGTKPGKGSTITLNNGSSIDVTERPAEVIKRIDKDRRKG